MSDLITKTIDLMLRPDHFKSTSKFLKLGRRKLIAIGRRLLTPGQTKVAALQWINDQLDHPLPRTGFYYFADRFFHLYDQIERDMGLPALVAFTPGEVAARLRITTNAATKLIDSGRLESIDVQGQSRVSSKALKSFLNGPPKQPATKTGRSSKHRGS